MVATSFSVITSFLSGIANASIHAQVHIPGAPIAFTVGENMTAYGPVGHFPGE